MFSSDQVFRPFTSKINPSAKSGLYHCSQRKKKKTNEPDTIFKEQSVTDNVDLLFFFVRFAPTALCKKKLKVKNQNYLLRH